MPLQCKFPMFVAVSGPAEWAPAASIGSKCPLFPVSSAVCRLQTHGLCGYYTLSVAAFGLVGWEPFVFLKLPLVVSGAVGWHPITAIGLKATADKLFGNL